GTPDSAPPTRGSSPTAASLVAPERVHRDISKLPRLQQQMYLTAQRGADWLCRANQADGRFLHGYLPALRAPLEGDHYLRQAGAAFALARCARLLGQERYAAVARQAILTLLLETATDPQDPRVRQTTLPLLATVRVRRGVPPHQGAGLRGFCRGNEWLGLYPAMRPARPASPPMDWWLQGKP